MTELNSAQQQKVTALVTALDARYVKPSELTTALSGNYVAIDEDNVAIYYSTEYGPDLHAPANDEHDYDYEIVNKAYLESRLSNSIPTDYLTEHQDLSDYIMKDDTVGLVKNDGSIDTNTYLTTGTASSTYVAQVSGKDLSDNNFTNAYKTALDNLSTDMSGKTVTLEEKTTPTTGYLKTYDIKQGGTSIGVIDIPKDLVVTQGTLVTNPAGQTAGKYLELTIANQNEKVYINVADLAHIYSADNSTLQISNDTFSIKNGGVGTTQIANSSVTTGKLDAGVATQWKSDADTEIEAYLTALASALTPSS